jgi:hypothetical protein
MEGTDEITHKPMRRMSNGSLGKLLRRGADSFDIAGHQRFDNLVPMRRVALPEGGVQPHPPWPISSLSGDCDGGRRSGSALWILPLLSAHGSSCWTNADSAMAWSTSATESRREDHPRPARDGGQGPPSRPAWTSGLTSGWFSANGRTAFGRGAGRI